MSAPNSSLKHGDRHNLLSTQGGPGGYDYVVVQLQGGAVYAGYDKFGNFISSNNVPDIGALLNALVAQMPAGNTQGYGGGGKIFVTTGVYTYSTTANIAVGGGNSAGIELFGAGRNRTVFKPSTSGLVCLNLNNHGSYICRLNGFKIANNNSSTTGTGIQFTAGNPFGELWIEDIEIRDLTSNTIKGTISVGYNNISGCYLLDADAQITQTGQFPSTTSLSFIGNVVYNDNNTASVTITGSNVIIANNTFNLAKLTVTAAGGATDDGPSLAIIGNTFIQGGGNPTAITLSNLGSTINKSAVTITGNIFPNPGADAGTWLSIGANWSNVVVSGNVITLNGASKTLALGSGLLNVTIVNNPGYNPIGSIVNMFNTSTNTIGFNGSTATPVENVDYVVIGSPVLITSTGGTGVSIATKDGGGNLVQSYGSSVTATRVAVGYKVNFGTFSGAPTVTLWAE